MKKVSNKNIFIFTLAILLALEVISIWGFINHWIMYGAFLLVVIITFFVSLNNLAYGFIILLTELVVGSQGYLLSIGGIEHRLSLRIGLWIVVMSIWLVKDRHNIFKTKALKPYYFGFSLLLIALVISYAIAYWSGNDLALIGLEGKRWVYLLTILPAVMVFKDRSIRQKLFIVLLAASLWLAFKTIVLLFIFSHDIGFKETIYAWLRYNYLGEVTKLPNNFYRIFLQSQIFSVLAFFFTLSLFFKNLINNHWRLNKKIWFYGLFTALSLTAILISLSRSFWLGVVVAFIISALGALIIIKPKIKNFCLICLFGLGVGLTSLIFLFITISWPYPKALFSFNTSLLTDRANTSEPAAASRWALLPIMKQAIIERPILGYGLGKTLTYKTSDPRIIQSSATGEYTTYAFEWGWLDIWLKLGLLGLIVYLIFLSLIIKQIWLNKNKPAILWPALASLLALIVLNIFTPYLNHPLGFGYLAIIMIIAHQGQDQALA